MASNPLPPNVARSVKLILISLDNPKPVKRVEALQELQKLLSSAGLTEKQEVYEQVKTVLYGVSDASIAQELSKLQSAWFPPVESSEEYLDELLSQEGSRSPKDVVDLDLEPEIADTKKPPTSETLNPPVPPNNKMGDDEVELEIEEVPTKKVLLAPKMPYPPGAPNAFNLLMAGYKKSPKPATLASQPQPSANKRPAPSSLLEAAPSKKPKLKPGSTTESKFVPPSASAFLAKLNEFNPAEPPSFNKSAMMVTGYESNSSSSASSMATPDAFASSPFATASSSSKSLLLQSYTTPKSLQPQRMLGSGQDLTTLTKKPLAGPLSQAAPSGLSLTSTPGPTASPSPFSHAALYQKSSSFSEQSILSAPKPVPYQKMTWQSKASAVSPSPQSSASDTTSAYAPKPVSLEGLRHMIASTLSKEQKRIVEKALGGASFFFTGAAGTGKSYVLKEIIRLLTLAYQDEPEAVNVVAPTGMAAIAIGGMTIHSFAGIGLGAGTATELLAVVRKRGQAIKRWRRARVLIIDEVSMLSADLFDSLDHIAKSVRACPDPFGGIQLILCGDFFQLPPVLKEMNPEKRVFCFQATSWKQCVRHTYTLMEVFRQLNDPQFIRILNEIRMGAISDQTYAELQKCINRKLSGLIEPTRLFPIKSQVQAFNDAKLKQLPGEEVLFVAQDASRYPDSPQLKAIQDGCPAVAELRLKVDAQVVVLRNLPEFNLVNGSRGIVIAFMPAEQDKRIPVVRFETGEELAMGAQVWSIMGGDEVLASRTQIPLALSWALSIHKSQGMTIQEIEISLRSVFEMGQAYVAISRVTSLSGLRIAEDFSKDKIKAHPNVVDFYKSLSGI